VEFENGQREVISRNALRRGKKLKECVEALKQIEGYAGRMTPAGISNLADKALTFDG
jgi:hypothetical protein